MELQFDRFGWSPPSPISLRFTADPAPPAPQPVSVGVRVLVNPVVHLIRPVNIRFTPSPQYCYWDDGGGVIDGTPVLPPIDFDTPIEPQIKRAYIMRPYLTCTRVSDNQPIIITGVSISDTRGQYASAIDIEFSSRIDAERAHNELLHIEINGYDFYAIAEQPIRRELFGSATYSSGCRSRVAELADPWCGPISYTNTVDRSLAGMLEDILLNTGWTVQLLGLPDFVVPAGAFSTIGKSPIDAVNEVITQLGCMIRSDDAARKLVVTPRWPVAPWVMGATVAAVNIHDSVILSYDTQMELKQQCDVCWLRGEQQGISARVKRAGSAGAVATADISAQMIVTEQAARIAGTVAIADTGNKQKVSVSLPVMADLPPLTKGMLIGVTYRDEIFKALCDSVTINATVGTDGDIDVTQSVTLVRSYV